TSIHPQSRMKVLLVVSLLVAVINAMSYRGPVQNRQISRSRISSQTISPSFDRIESSSRSISTPPPFTVVPGLWVFLSDKAPPTNLNQFVRYYPVWKEFRGSRN
ncbi:hypothetical protein PFISCL1PPCAC_28507, partial [Pristionchus fissidentatus]